MTRCVICKQPVVVGSKPGHAKYHQPHTDQELADHMRAELIRRGYPDPWRERDERSATVR